MLHVFTLTTDETDELPLALARAFSLVPDVELPYVL